MSSRAEKQVEQEEEDFYDCHETLERPDRKEEDKQGDRLQSDREEEEQVDRLHKEEKSDRLQEEKSNRLQEKSDRLQEEKSDRLPEEKSDRWQEEKSDRLQEEESDRLQEEESDRLQEEESDRLQEEDHDRLQEENVGLHGDRQQEGNGPQDDSDSELKAESAAEVEFDEEYLMEIEKELTEEEKESRRQESLTLKEKGNSQFKSGEWSDAALSYTEALGLCPLCFSKERSVLFSNRAAARLHLDMKEKAISDCSKAIELNPDYVRALLRRAELYEQTEKLDEALEDYQKVLEHDPNHTGARQACMRLPQQIHERNEKLKEEMMSKLKDLGNMFLRPFGLSTSNFQVNQDANTGSYSINFVQNSGKR